MGAHPAPHAHPVASHARLAGRTAFTAVAALALTGAGASLASAHEAPQLPSHDLQSGAHQLSGAAEKVDAGSVASHGKDLQHQSSEVASSLKDKGSHAASTLKDKGSHAASTLKSKAPTSFQSFSSSLPADMATDAGHAVSNTKNDITHAQHNWSAAAKDGLTAQEASDQVGLMGDDVAHAFDNGKADLQHWQGKLSSSAPAELPTELPSVLSFG